MIYKTKELDEERKDYGFCFVTHGHHAGKLVYVDDFDTPGIAICYFVRSDLVVKIIEGYQLIKKTHLFPFACSVHIEILYSDYLTNR